MTGSRPHDRHEERIEFSPPRTEISEQWVAELGSALAARDDIVAAYLVTATYISPFHETHLQDELHFELVEPPEEGESADRELFLEVGREVPTGGVGFTFPRRRKLREVRDVGMLLWRRN